MLGDEMASMMENMKVILNAGISIFCSMDAKY